MEETMVRELSDQEKRFVTEFTDKAQQRLEHPRKFIKKETTEDDLRIHLGYTDVNLITLAIHPGAMHCYSTGLGGDRPYFGCTTETTRLGLLITVRRIELENIATCYESEFLKLFDEVSRGALRDAIPREIERAQNFHRILLDEWKLKLPA